MKFKAQLHEYSQWREDIAQAIEMYRDWCDRYDLSDVQSREAIVKMLAALNGERITLAFSAEFSRGKTELINALFFSEMGLNLLPSSQDHATMCPVELFYDPDACYIRLLDIETRLEETSLIEYKQNPDNWTQIALDFTSPSQMQQALKTLLAVKKVSREHAAELGLWNEIDASKAGLLDVEELEIPCWRYALISLAHPLLKQGLCVLDTPGLSALVIEPELTLNILPSAEAIIFIFAADLGLIENDLEIWHKYIHKAARHEKLELAVVMNKIDTLLQDQAGDQRSIATQSHKAAELLAIDEQLILPLSAKQALKAKIKTDADLLAESRLAILESYLADNILSHRCNILQQTISSSLSGLLSESVSLSEAKYKRGLDQLDEFKKIDCDNADMMTKLMTETRDRQKAYLLSVEDFHNSHRIFRVQARKLVDSLNKERIDAVMLRSKDELTKSLTTYGMKQNIQLLFDDLRNALQDAVKTAHKTASLVASIHKKFADEYGFKEIEPVLFSINEYQFQLEQILEEGDRFRSSTKTTMTEQTVVVKQLYSSIISRICDVFAQAQQDASQWSNHVFLPLMHQIKDHKKLIDSRLHMLRKMSGSKEGDADNIAQLEAALVPLRQQLIELQVIIKAMK